MTIWVAALLALAAPEAPPPAPPANDAASGALPAEDLRMMAPAIGPLTATQPIGGDAKADKVLLLGRQNGTPVVTAMMAVPPGDAAPAPVKGTLALVRSRERTKKGEAGPLPADRDFVTAHRLPLYLVLVGKGSTQIWELAWYEGRVRHRPVDNEGAAGPWLD